MNEREQNIQPPEWKRNTQQKKETTRGVRREWYISRTVFSFRARRPRGRPRVCLNNACRDRCRGSIGRKLYLQRRQSEQCGNFRRNSSGQGQTAVVYTSCIHVLYELQHSRVPGPVRFSVTDLPRRRARDPQTLSHQISARVLTCCPP